MKDVISVRLLGNTSTGWPDWEYEREELNPHSGQANLFGGDPQPKTRTVRFIDVLTSFKEGKTHFYLAPNNHYNTKAKNLKWVGATVGVVKDVKGKAEQYIYGVPF